MSPVGGNDWAGRLPEGMQYQGRDGEEMSFGLSLPSDEEGFFPLHCPEDEEHSFKLQPDTDDAGAAELPDALWCPYCGHTSDDAWDFMPEQREYAHEAMQAAMEQYVHQQFNDMLGDTFGRSSGRSSGAFGISIEFTPGNKPPVRQLPPMAVRETRRTLECAQCHRTYAVYNVTTFCPGCGRLGSLQEFDERAMQHRARLEALQQLPAALSQSYAETGVLASIYESTVKDAFTSLEVLLKVTFEQRTAPGTPVTARGAYQRLEDAADLYRDHLGLDMRAALGADWDELLDMAQLRHVLTHNSGIVDQAYLDKVPTSRHTVGSRFTVSLLHAEEALRLVQQVATALRA